MTRYILHCPECNSTNTTELEPVGGVPGRLCQDCEYMADEDEFTEEAAPDES